MKDPVKRLKMLELAEKDPSIELSKEELKELKTLRAYTKKAKETFKPDSKSIQQVFRENRKELDKLLETDVYKHKDLTFKLVAECLISTVNIETIKAISPLMYQVFTALKKNYLNLHFYNMYEELDLPRASEEYARFLHDSMKNPTTKEHYIVRDIYSQISDEVLDRLYDNLCNFNVTESISVALGMSYLALPISIKTLKLHIKETTNKDFEELYAKSNDLPTYEEFMLIIGIYHTILDKFTKLTSTTWNNIKNAEVPVDKMLKDFDTITAEPKENMVDSDNAIEKELKNLADVLDKETIEALKLIIAKAKMQ